MKVIAKVAGDTSVVSQFSYSIVVSVAAKIVDTVPTSVTSFGKDYIIVDTGSALEVYLTLGVTSSLGS